MKKIVIDLIMANACNKKCDYCCIKFNGKKLEKDSIDYLSDYLNKHNDDYDVCLINFFGGEPLLNFDNIVYFINKNSHNSKISYSIGTNGFLLDEEKFIFLNDNNVKIYLSFHADKESTYRRLLDKKYLLNSKDIEVNFIVRPDNVIESYDKFDSLIKFGFKVINIIPVMPTMKWTMEAIKDLNTFINFIDEKYINNKDFKISKFSFFDGIIQEKTFVLDYDLNLYQDSSDELYIGKQFDKLGKTLSSEIEKTTFICNLKTDNYTIKDIMNKHSIKDVFNLVYKLPKKMSYVKDYYLIYKIMNKKKQESKRGSYIIFSAD